MSDDKHSASDDATKALKELLDDVFIASESLRNAHDVQPVFGLGARYSITFFFSHWPVPRILILSIAEDFCVD